MRTIPLNEPDLSGNELRYLTECVETGYVSSVGEFVDRFEAKFAEFVGARFAIACSSGTAALHTALLVAGVKPGSTVPVSTMTFVASVNAIAYCGATPLLVDSEPGSWNLNTAALHDHVVALAERGAPFPDVIEPVHILGVPVDMEPLLDLRERFGIVIVEDAAEALGASSADGRMVGTIGDLGCFSLNGNKLVTAGGGGVIVTDDAETARRARHLTTQARLPGQAYHHDEIGFNYRLTNIAAAVGLAQLERVESFLADKQRIATAYRERLSDASRFSWPQPYEGANSSHWLNSVQILDRDRDETLARLSTAGVVARPVWTPCHRHAPYRSCPTLGGDVAESLARTSVSLPSSFGLTEQDINRVLGALL